MRASSRQRWPGAEHNCPDHDWVERPRPFTGHGDSGSDGDPHGQGHAHQTAQGRIQANPAGAADGGG